MTSEERAAPIVAEWVLHQDTHQYLQRCDECEGFIRRIVAVLETEE
jgi:hypothetical protein